MPKENPEKLLSEINNLLKNSELQQNLQKNAYDFILQNYSWKILLQKYENFYKSLM